MENLRAFKIKYNGPTDKRGSRVRVHDLRFNKVVTLKFPPELSQSVDVARVFLNSLGISTDFETDLGGPESMILSRNFKTQIKD